MKYVIPLTSVPFIFYGP